MKYTIMNGSCPVLRTKIILETLRYVSRTADITYSAQRLSDRSHTNIFEKTLIE